MWPWWIIYFVVPVFVGIAVTEYKSDIFRLLKAAFVHGTRVMDFELFTERMKLWNSLPSLVVHAPSYYCLGRVH